MRKLPDRASWCWFTQRGERRLRIVLYDRGVRSFETLPREATEREAARRVKILTAALAQESAQAPLDWDEFIDAFLEDRKRRRCRASTIDTYRAQILSVARILPDADPMALTADDGELYCRTTEEDGLSTATIVGSLQAITIAQRWAVKKKWLPCATWEDVVRPEIVAERSHLRPEQAGRFLRSAAKLSAHPPGQARPEDWATWEAAAWLFFYGLRVGELARMRVGDIELDSGLVFVADRKSGRTKTKSSERAFLITSERARECLRRTFAGVDAAEYAFPITRAHGKGGREKTKWFGRRCTATLEDAGIKQNVSPHGLRHTTATAAVIAGADMHSLQAILGHSTAELTSKTYAHVTSVQRSRGAGEVIGAWLDESFEPKPRLRIAN